MTASFSHSRQHECARPCERPATSTDLRALRHPANRVRPRLPNCYRGARATPEHVHRAALCARGDVCDRDIGWRAGATPCSYFVPLLRSNMKDGAWGPYSPFTVYAKLPDEASFFRSAITGGGRCHSRESLHHDVHRRRYVAGSKMRTPGSESQSTSARCLEGVRGSSGRKRGSLVGFFSG